MATSDWIALLGVGLVVVGFVLGGVKVIVDRAERRLTGFVASTQAHLEERQDRSEAAIDKRQDRSEAAIDKRVQHVDARFASLEATVRDGLHATAAAIDRVNDRLDVLTTDNRSLGERLARIEGAS